MVSHNLNILSQVYTIKVEPIYMGFFPVFSIAFHQFNLPSQKELLERFGVYMCICVFLSPDFPITKSKC